ncbi:MAG: NUDIX domain-containing protein [Ruminococcaceae bacterium]|nr:NUDIX domain-containing protein [Oscillospiraceae bacterium]
MHYIYCPKCGNKLQPRQAGDDGAVPYCESCSRYWFDSFSNLVMVLVYNEQDEIVLTRQGYLSQQYANLTSGYIQPGESAEEAAAREVREELGFAVQKLTFAGTCWFEQSDMLITGFAAYVPKQDFCLSEEVDSAQWVPYEEAPALMFPDQPGNSIWVVYRHYLKMREQGLL